MGGRSESFRTFSKLSLLAAVQQWHIDEEKVLFPLLIMHDPVPKLWPKKQRSDPPITELKWVYGERKYMVTIHVEVGDTYLVVTLFAWGFRVSKLAPLKAPIRSFMDE